MRLSQIFAANVRRLRLERGWTQLDVAKKLGCGKSQAGGYELGNRDYNLISVEKFAEVFQVPAHILLIEVPESKDPLK